MDLVHVDEVVRPNEEKDIPVWRAGDAFLSGGTWLFSEAQPAISRLIDLSRLRWPAVVCTGETVEIAANCTYQELEHFDWSNLPAAQLFSVAIRSLSASFKTYGLATVGGNICLAYAKGMMAPVFVALGGEYELSSGAGLTRKVAARDFQKGVRRTILYPGEYLRKIILPFGAFSHRCALKRASFTATSHATAMVITTVDPATGSIALTLSGALAYPVRVELSSRQSAKEAIDAVCEHHPMIGDAHGSKQYRQALLHWLATETLTEVLT